MPTSLPNNRTLDFHARSNAEPIDPSVMVKLIASEVAIAEYFAVALATVLVYHSIITLDKEVHYFWPKPRNPISLIYFANRYAGFIGAICVILSENYQENSATNSFWISSFSNWVIVVLIDYILLIRVLALFHQDRKIEIFLKVFLGLDAAAGFALLIHGNVLEKTTAGNVVPGLTVCSGFIPPQAETIASWTIPLVYGLILLVLALWKASEYWRMSSGFEGFLLIRVLIQDQLLYYGFAISCCILRIVNITVIGIDPFVASALAAAASPTSLCILGGQMLINLKEAGEMGANGGTNYRAQSAVSDIEFA